MRFKVKKLSRSKVIDSVAICMLKFAKGKLNRIPVSYYFVVLLIKINCSLS